MTYKARIAVEMLRRAGIALACVAVYLAVAGAIAFGLWWGFEVPADPALAFGMMTPVVVAFIAAGAFILYESSKDKVDTLDRTIMRGLGQTPRYRDDE